MRKFYLLLGASVLSVAVVTSAFSQSSNARVSGTVTDATEALIPGVSQAHS